MGKSGFATTIPYGDELHEVTPLEYKAWDDALGACDGTKEAMEWATYDILIGQGYFVSQPQCKRPEKPKVDEDSKEGESRNPGRRKPMNDGFEDYAAWEPEWSKEKILSERTKLLNEREKMTTIKEKALTQKILEQQILEAAKKTPQSNSDRSYTILGAVGIIGILLLGILIYSS